ncbi:hypothetical protein ACOMHN_035885 [Nucella lapillus]
MVVPVLEEVCLLLGFGVKVSVIRAQTTKREELPEVVAQAFIQQLEDVDNNGKVMLVDGERGAVYRRRFVVDDDGVSNPLDVDEPLTSHPPVPGHNL